MFTLLDLFAGAGGLSTGFDMTEQFNIVGMSENNPNAIKTYEKNHKGVKNYGNILKLPFEDIKRECGDIDVIIGGPPCQGFSNANRQRRKLINGSNELVKAYVKAIEELKPKVFVMENVKTIDSDKHHFCVTYADEKHIKEDLLITPEDKDIVLYEGKYADIISENIENVRELTLINDELLYILKGLINPKKDIKKYLNKSGNKVGVKKIIESISDISSHEDWFINILQKSKTALTNILIEESCNDEYRKALQNFWNIQRLCLGIEELEEKDVIYQYKLGISDDKIVVSVQAYVVIDFIKKSFEKLKYKISEGGVLKAAEFGVPQTRERFILIGVSEEQYDEGLGVELPKPILKNSSEFYSVYDAISDLEAYEPTTGSMSEKIERHLDRAPENFYEKIVFNEDNDIIYNHVCTATRDKAKERFALINQGENFHNLPEAYKDTYDNPDRTQNTIYKRLRYDEPSDTVINVRKSMWIHPTKNRAISAREAARLQSFPDSYEFVGTKDSVYQQIGNAVPPILGRAVAEKVLELLKCKEKYKKLKEIYEDFKKVE